jgi:hypothetical protein
MIYTALCIMFWMHVYPLLGLDAISQLSEIFLFSGHEPIYFIENKEKTLRASYDRGTQIFDYME